MDKLVKHAIRMLEIVEGENDFFRNDTKRQADIARAVYDTILRVQALERKADRKTNADQHVQHVGSVESVEPMWAKEKHEAFYTFLWNVINPNEMQDYIGMFETKDEPQKWEKPPKFEHKGIQTACVSVPMALIEDEPQTCSVSGRPYSECADCEHFRCTADEPQTERGE